MSNLKWSQDRGKKWRELSASLEAMMAPIDVPLIQKLDLPQSATEDFCVADVACGAGGTTLKIAEALSTTSAQVMGFDISPDLIEEAQHRALAQNLKVQFKVLDIGRERPQEVLFNRVVSRFGTMFFEEPSRAFANLHQWLSPNGNFVFAVWGPRAENLWLDATNKILAKLISLTPPEPDSPGPFRYADVEPYKALLATAGFKDLHAHKWEGDLAIGGGMGPHAAARFSLSMFAVAQLLAEHTDEVRTKAFELLSEYYATSLMQGEVVRAPASVWLVSGRA